MADAVAAVRALLAANVTLTGTVPAARITAGVIPQGSALPAIGITHVSTVRRQTPRAADDKFAVSRIQVTVNAETYPSQRAVLDLVRGAVTRCPGTVGGTNVDSILIDVEGPDFVIGAAQASIYAGSQDLRVRWNAS